MGDIEQNLAKQAVRSGQPIPDRIANAPQLLFGLDIFLQAFFDLDSERSHGMGLTPIAWSSIRGYAVAYEFDDEMTDDLLYIIRQVDNDHLNELRKKLPHNGNA